jgi:hypothetical protein
MPISLFFANPLTLQVAAIEILKEAANLWKQVVSGQSLEAGS